MFARLRAGVRWASQVQVWTTGVLFALLFALAAQVVSIPFGGASITLSPRGTVEALYEAAQEGDYERAYNLLDEAGRAEAAGLGSSGWRELVDGLSRGRSITRVTYGSQRNYGRNVVVGALVDFEDGTLRAATEELVREGTEWRVMWPPGTRRFTETVRKYEPWFGR